MNRLMAAQSPHQITPIVHAMTKLRTSQEARDWLSYMGITIAQWARDHKFSEPLVREILAGRKKCLRGQSHNIAVALGMKRGVPTTRPARVAPTQGLERSVHVGAAA